jgi:hypothetical protein
MFIREQVELIKEIFEPLQVACKFSDKYHPNAFRIIVFSDFENNITEYKMIFDFGKIIVYDKIILIKVKIPNNGQLKYDDPKYLIEADDIYPSWAKEFLIAEFHIKKSNDFNDNLDLIRQILNNYFY